MKLTKGDFLEDLDFWLETYFSHFKTLNYSNNTIMLYERVLNEFREYSLDFQDKIELKEVKNTYILNFLAYLEMKSKNINKKLSKKTKLTYLRVITSFFTFISENNEDLFEFSFNFSKFNVRNKKREEKLEYLNDDEVQRLINVLEKQKIKKDNYASFRNAFLVKLMLYAGLRISEALKVRLCDFSEDKEGMLKICIFAKGGKEQFAYVKKDYVDDELDYFKEHLKEQDYIMQTNTGKLLNRSNAFIIVNRIYVKALISKKGLHLLRHSLAMKLISQNINLVVIQKILRHASMQTTTIYAKANSEMVRKALGNLG
ncbi:tyrosine-type recombinase/integrase [Campylobacter upsaliensis]|nr:recombinase XerC [Campylobacter upsaliensis]EAK0838468.1 recombinase XerC [Campylobacter upsaliensis]EGJ6309367.1 tyrosine-type recombinase/integrase [Campylobacter upsaliensis]EGR6367906.1 tyrosine-type recombinase/integrase [Campylobacter upsaliensis]EIS1948857.1 tyrosine-type recombinase/integrase [Campylobacter upsaliensis]